MVTRKVLLKELYRYIHSCLEAGEEQKVALVYDTIIYLYYLCNDNESIYKVQNCVRSSDNSKRARTHTHIHCHTHMHVHTHTHTHTHMHTRLHTHTHKHIDCTKLNLHPI